MPSEEEMTITERRKYLKVMKPRYLKASREEQSTLLTEMEQVAGLHRNSLLRLLHAPTLERKRRSKQRGRTYGPEVEHVVLTVWESLDDVCAPGAGGNGRAASEVWGDHREASSNIVILPLVSPTSEMGLLTPHDNYHQRELPQVTSRQEGANAEWETDCK